MYGHITATWSENWMNVSLHPILFKYIILINQYENNRPLFRPAFGEDGFVLCTCTRKSRSIVLCTICICIRTHKQFTWIDTKYTGTYCSNKNWNAATKVGLHETPGTSFGWIIRHGFNLIRSMHIPFFLYDLACIGKDLLEEVNAAKEALSE